MGVIYLVNLSAAALLLLVPVWFSRRYLRLPAINPFTLVVAVNLPVQLMKLYGGPMLTIDGGLSDPSYQFAVLMNNLQGVSQAAGLVLFYKVFSSLRVDRSIPLQSRVLSPSDLRRLERAFLVLYAVSLGLLASAEFGVLNWLLNPRTGYQLYRTGQGHWYALAVSSISAAMVLGCLARPAPSRLLLRGALYIALGYLLGSKSILLNIFVTLTIFLWFIRWRHLQPLLWAGAPVVFSLLVWNLYLALAEEFDIEAIVSYFDYYKNAADFYRDYLAGELRLFHGEVLLSSWWAYVPRALVPDKPTVYGVLHINELFYPGQAELTNTPAFGGAVEQFADFGLAGVLIFGLFSVQSITTALVGYLLFVRPGIDLRRVSVATFLLMLVQVSPGFGTYFPGLLYLLLLLGVALLSLSMRRRRRRMGGPFAAAHP